jgi:adenosylcobinamide-GDP ribazoletransferase
VRTAVAFLTRVPVGTGGDLARAAPLFPLVGAAIGGIVGGTAALLTPAFPALAAAGIAVAVELALTGALHADGLADSADGLAGRTPERALAIMRDHAVGTYGACALILDVLLKTVALAHAPDVLAVVAAFAVSRAAPLPLAAALPYARSTEGTGRAFTRDLGAARAAVGLALAAAIAVAAGQPLTLAALAGTTLAIGALARHRLQGVTGDVLGAATELTATIALLTTL